MRGRLLLGVTMLVTGVLMAGIVMLAGALLPEPEPPGDPITADIVYLPDPTSPGLDLERTEADGVHVSPSARRLMVDVASATNLAGIVLDAGPLAALDRGWLASQAEQGRVIVGINVPMATLQDLTQLDELGSPDGFRQEWFGRPFFSLAHRSPPGSSPHSAGRASDQILSPELIFHLVRLTARQARGSTP